MRGLNAFENLKSQVIGNFIMNLISVILSVIAAQFLTPKWVTVGLAAIFTFHYFIGVALSIFFIKHHGINLPIVKLLLFYIKVLVIFSTILLPLWLIKEQLPGGNLIQLLTVIAVSTLLYLGASKLFKVQELTSLIKVIRSGRQ